MIIPIELIPILLSLPFPAESLDFGILRGVAPNVAAFYNPAKDFVCFDGSVRIPFSLVNDDYCDCRDGSDEPGTSACPNGWFHCINAGFAATKVPSSRVNDGICDCCDGSDEWLARQCPNICRASMSNNDRDRGDHPANLFREGTTLRQQMIYYAKAMKFQLKERLIGLEMEKISVEKVKVAAEIAKNETEANKSAVMRKARQERLQRKMRKLLAIEMGPPIKSIQTPILLHVIKEAEEARIQFEYSQTLLESIQQKISYAKDKLNQDYGLEDAYASLDGQCFPFTDMSYVYVLCPFSQVTLTSKDSTALPTLVLGRWGHWSKDADSPMMIYDNGESCWEGSRHLSTVVLLDCGIENEIADAIETDMCEYQLTFATPAACNFLDDISRHEEL